MNITPNQPRHRRAAALAITVAAFAPTMLTAPHDAEAAQAGTAKFVSLPTPCRLADSRTADNTAPIANDTYRVSTANRCGLPANITALAVSAVAVANNAPGFVTLYEAGTTRPNVSHVNYAANEVRTNGAIVAVNDTIDAIDAYLLNGANLVVDVTGYFIPAASATDGRYTAMTPRRLLDTRSSGTKLNVGTPLTIARPADVPADAVAMVVNLTATDTNGSGFLSVSPAGTPQPGSSTLNFDAAHQTRAASVVVPINSAGFDVHASANATHLVVDIVGYMTGPTAPSSADGLLVLETPRRLLDSRGPSVLGNTVPLYPNGAVELSSGATNASAYITNITMIAAVPGFLSARPAGFAAQATTSSVNTNGASQPVANFATIAPTTRGVEIQTANTSHVIVDYFGRFTGTPMPATTAPKGNPAPAPDGRAVYPTGRCDTIAPGATGLNDITRAPVEYRQIGTSVQGRPIYAEYWGPVGANIKTVIVIGQTHGDECASTALTAQIRQNPPTSYGIWLIPALNVDGYVNHTRGNANGINLNRDGLNQTQPETRALIAFTGQVQPALSVHAHSPYGWVGYYGLRNYSSHVSTDSPLSKPIAARIASSMGWYLKGAGENSASQAFLWQGQRAVAPNTESILVEFPPMNAAEAQTITPRAPIQSFATVSAQAKKILEAIDAYM